MGGCNESLRGFGFTISFGGEEIFGRGGTGTGGTQIKSSEDGAEACEYAEAEVATEANESRFKVGLFS